MLVRIGTRCSTLALAQAMEAEQKLLQVFPQIETEIIKIKTSGDKITDKPLCDIGGKGLFIKEVEHALLEKKIDIAVHSMKDVPAFYDKEFVIPCILSRASPSDAFISLKYENVESLPINATVATCSIRRKVLLLNLRPDLNIVPLRGNVTTRISKLKSENYDAIILAESGLIRLGKQKFITQILSPKIMLSAVGQGAICIQCRSDDRDMIDKLRSLNHYPSYLRVLAERSFMKTINGSCSTPMAALANYLDDGRLHLSCMLSDEKKIVFAERTAFDSEAEKMGKDIGLELKNKLLVQ